MSESKPSENLVYRLFSSLSGIWKNEDLKTDDGGSGEKETNTEGQSPEIQKDVENNNILPGKKDLTEDHESVFGDAEQLSSISVTMDLEQTKDKILLSSKSVTSLPIPPNDTFQSTISSTNSHLSNKPPKSRRPMSASESMLYGISEVQSYIPRPATTINVPESVCSENIRVLPTRSILYNSENGFKKSQENPNVSILLKNPSLHSIATSCEEAVEEISQNSLKANKKTSQHILKEMTARVNEIISDEDDRFREKYSEWIAKLFHTQLIRLKRKLGDQFNEKLHSLLSQKDAEFTSLETKYSEKLVEFAEAAESFHNWVEALEEENRQLTLSKDSSIEQMQKELEMMDNHLETQLEKQLVSLKAENQKEIEDLISEHKKEFASMEDTVVKRHLSRFQITIATLKNENKELKKKCEKAAANPVAGESQVDAVFLQRTMEELQKRLSESERERNAMCEYHEDEIIALKKQAEKSIIEMSQRMASSQETINSLQKSHDREVQDFKNALFHQEAKYNLTVSELKRKYGTKIESLTQIIDKIQNDLKQ